MSISLVIHNNHKHQVRRSALVNHEIIWGYCVSLRFSTIFIPHSLHAINFSR